MKGDASRHPEDPPARPLRRAPKPAEGAPRPIDPRRAERDQLLARAATLAATEAELRQQLKSAHDQLTQRDQRIDELQHEAADQRGAHRAEMAGILHGLEFAEDASRTLEAELAAAREELAAVQSTRV